MSIRPNEDILGSFSLFPQRATLDNYVTFFTDPDWNSSYLNSHHLHVHQRGHVAACVALPAAYAFSPLPASPGTSTSSSGC